MPVMSTSYQRYGVLFCRTTCLNQRAKCEVAFFVSAVIAASWVKSHYLFRTKRSRQAKFAAPSIPHADESIRFGRSGVDQTIRVGHQLTDIDLTDLKLVYGRCGS